MAGEEQPVSPLAKTVTRLILFVAMLGAGISAVFSFSGNLTLALQICAGSAGLGLVILMIGGFLVAANRPEA